jgi:ketosteroid isomerase-like protein
MHATRLAGVVAASLAICSPTTFQAQTAADSASVSAFYGRWFGSARQGFTTYASFYAPDGYILPPNAAPVVGREAIAAWFEQASASTLYTTQPQGIEVNELRFLSSTWVLHRSTLRGQRVPKAGGAAVPFETKYVDLLHRQVTGDWAVAFRMWSDNR